MPIVAWTITAMALPIAINAQEARTTRAESKMMKMDQAQVDRLIQSWPEKSLAAAKATMEKYGAPQEATASMLVWHNNGPWKCTVVSNKPIQHDWPNSHQDVMEQAIDYKVPPEMFDDLAQFDGSVMVERTKGEISARCEKELANFLALNLAHEIVTGKRDVASARREYEKQITAVLNKESAPLTEKLMFQPPRMAQGDPDKTTIDPARTPVRAEEKQ